MTLKEAYSAAEWPILVLIGALIPIGAAVQQNGTAKVIATLLAAHVGHLPDFAVLAALMAATMLVTPILHHAAAVLVMGPIAASLAQQSGCKIDPFLMAVAFGAGSDFPVAGSATSRTRWSWASAGIASAITGSSGRLPLSVMVVALGVPLIMLFWPLH